MLCLNQRHLELLFAFRVPNLVCINVPNLNIGLRLTFSHYIDNVITILTCQKLSIMDNMVETPQNISSFDSQIYFIFYSENRHLNENYIFYFSFGSR